jgi:sporulation and spore germination protein
MTTTGRPRREAGKGFWIILAMLVGALGVCVAFLGWYLSSGDAEPLPVLGGAESSAARDWTGSRGVVLYHAASDGLGMITEELAVPARDRTEDEILDVMTSLCQAVPPSGAVRLIPAGTEVRAVFLNREKGHVVLDLSAPLTANLSGGTASEQALLRSLLRTLAFNFPELRTCNLLVDGAQVATLAGHVRTDAPFVLGRWR